MIMVGPLGPSARARVPCSFVLLCLPGGSILPAAASDRTERRHLAIVDALLVARVAAEPLFDGSRRLGLDLLHLPVCARSQRRLATSIIAISRTGARTIVEANISASVQQQSGHCCRI